MSVIYVIVSQLVIVTENHVQITVGSRWWGCVIQKMLSVIKCMYSGILHSLCDICLMCNIRPPLKTVTCEITVKTVRAVHGVEIITV